MAMAGRCLHRLLFASSGSTVPSRLRFALPAFSAASAPAASSLCHDAPSTGGIVTGASSDFLARDSNPSSLRASCSFSIIDGSPSATNNNQGFQSHQLAATAGIATFHCNFSTRRVGLQSLAALDIHNITSTSSSIRSLSTKTSPDIAVISEKPKTLEDFQHEEIVGPTVERDISPVADELREALDILQKRMLSFQKSLVVLGGLQGVGAVWCYVSWHALDPTWQLVPSALLSLLLAFVLRQALQPISFFGKLEERSRLRIITLSLMIAKGFSSFFNRARIFVAASAVALLCVLLYNPSTYVLGLLGILK